jgi:hypothetical protein
MKTSKLKSLGMLTAISLSSILTVNNAYALCSSGFAKVSDVYTYNVNGSVTGYIYTVPEHQSLPSVNTYFYTANQFALTQAMLAKQNNQSLYIYGDASTCPTSGTYHYGGTVNYLYDY